jgi:Skp family chaperone for outer membrane proteins
MMKFIFTGILTLVFGALSARADLKVALIDTSKAFDAYYRTQDNASRIAAKRAEYEKEFANLQEEYDDQRREAQKLEDAVNDTSTPAVLRKNDDAVLAQKVQDLQSMEQEIARMHKLDGDEIRDELIRSHEELDTEMMKVIVAYVSAEGYDVVLDSSPGNNGLPFPMRSVKIVDLTDEIIARLNASAPAH